ncbi:pRiA4b ORF-3-like protein [Singulisphaera sp. GP187]|nr:pRiA4b ORF-3-like protein [Singulisphaera sp. GP187]
MKTPDWTHAMETCLQSQVITADQPGPVLKDFGLILDYVGTKGVKSAGKYHLLPIACIPELDPHLSRSLDLSLTLKRPQLRSHPYLQGLNLLLRASGLGRVEGTGAKSRLSLDPAMLEQWNRLNPTEQYFNLLEAWLLYGRPIMVGDSNGRRRGSMLSSCMQTWLFLPENSRQVETRANGFIELIGISEGYYQLALMDLFGLMNVGQPPRGSERWLPTSLKPNPFGDAVFTLLAIKVDPFSGNVVSDEEQEEDEATEEEEAEGEDSDEPEFGIWQSVFQPYFPEWQESLVFPKREAREGTFLFRVSLAPTLWRRIAMPADSTLDELVGWILRAMKFDSDHLYMFTYTDSMGSKVSVSSPESDEGPWTDEISIGRLPLEPGQSMELLYDFGDCWRFTVKLEKIEPPNVKIKAPGIVESHGAAPKQYSNWDDEDEDEDQDEGE